MKKTTIEIFRYRKLGLNWAWDGPKPSEEDILNKVLEFAKGKDIKVYRHLLRKDWVENKKYKPIIVDIGYNEEMGRNEKVKTPRGDEIWNLVIYYQDI